MRQLTLDVLHYETYNTTLRIETTFLCARRAYRLMKLGATIGKLILHTGDKTHCSRNPCIVIKVAFYNPAEVTLEMTHGCRR